MKTETALSALSDSINTLARGDSDLRQRLCSLLEKAYEYGWHDGYDKGCYETCFSMNETDS